MTSRTLLIRAVVITTVFAGLHLAGCRDWTSVLCGTSPLATSRSIPAALGGAAYITFYIGATVVAPICLIAAILLKLSAIIGTRSLCSRSLRGAVHAVPQQQKPSATIQAFVWSEPAGATAPPDEPSRWRLTLDRLIHLQSPWAHAIPAGRMPKGWVS